MKKKNNPFYKGKKFLRTKFKKHVSGKNPHIKVKIVAERFDGKKIEIPLTKYEIYNLCDFFYICNDQCGILKLNKVDFGKLPQKIEFLEHDVVNGGIGYGYNERSKQWTIKSISYLYKEPKWK